MFLSLNPMVIEMLIETKTETRYHRLLQEAETNHLFKQLEANNLGLRDRILPKLGDLLIAAGQKLKAGQASSPAVSS